MGMHSRSTKVASTHKINFQSNLIYILLYMFGGHFVTICFKSTDDNSIYLGGILRGMLYTYNPEVWVHIL